LNENNKQPERLFLLRRLALSFRHENQHDTDLVKTNLDSTKKYFVNKNDDSMNTEAMSFKFDRRKLELSFNSPSKSRRKLLP